MSRSHNKRMFLKNKSHDRFAKRYLRRMERRVLSNLDGDTVITRIGKSGLKSRQADCMLYDYWGYHSLGSLVKEEGYKTRDFYYYYGK